MLDRRLFVQVCAVMLVGLMLFALIMSLAWNALVNARFNRAVQDQATSLSVLLLPDAEEPAAAQGAALERLADHLSIDFTLYEADGQLIGASDAPASWVEPTEAPGVWEPIRHLSHWMTVLPDGRVVILDISQLSIPNEAIALTVSFVFLALIIAVLMYPIVRRVTRRLERLQSEVEQIGAGDLSARATVDGGDEVAKLAISFNRSAETIEDLINRQRMLLANASHELRTPLARIRMGIEMLETRDTPQRRADLRREIRELDALIDELILMTRFDTGAALETYETVDLTAIAAEECARTEGCTLSGDTVEIPGDARMLRHLVRNLLDNASKHGAPPIRIELQTSSDAVVLTVSDAGPGINPEDQRKVFEPFYRGAGKQNTEGSGLGLPLVARIAEAHGANLEVRNTPRSEVAVSFACAG
ncbi:HAMP domain-containing sensor histidine kinase [Ruegeria sp. ANG10]|uniref:sensor histidine kinase n=1 Tax=Ruegeria sp. ANG10 TaxID=3042467 RepID=UPI0034564E53